MAIRKPTAPTARSAAMAELLAKAANETRFTAGSLVEGTVTAVKGDDAFVDIGYKSEGAVPLSEFGDEAEVKPGDKVVNKKYTIFFAFFK